jgi:hypothetical protein
MIKLSMVATVSMLARKQEVANGMNFLEREFFTFNFNIEQHTDDVIFRRCDVLLHHFKQIATDVLAALDTLFHGRRPVKARLPGVKIVQRSGSNPSWLTKSPIEIGLATFHKKSNSPVG